MAITPVGLLRKIGKFVRGGVTPSQVFIGFLLGILIGMTPGFNLTLLIGIALVILLNANGGMVALGFALGKVLCLALAPVTFEIGHFLIHGMGLEGLFRAAGDTPVVALMDLHYYCVTGGLAAGLVVGIAGGLVLGHVINGVRKGVAAAGGASEKLQKLLGGKLVRLVMRIVFGKRKGALADLAGKKSPLIRRSGVIVCVVIVLLLVAGQFLLVDVFFKDALRSGLEAAVGAEVNIDRADLALFGGRLEVHGLQITDADKPTHNLLEAARLSGDISGMGLLTKRVVIDELTVVEARTDSPREAPGEVFERPEPPEPPAEEDALSEYFQKARKYREYFEKLKKYLEERDANTPEPTPEEIEEEKQRLRELARARGYFRLSAQGLLSRHPAWVIRKLDVQGLRVENVPGPVRVEGKELSAAPDLHDRPMRLRITEANNTLADLLLDCTGPAGEHRLSLHTPPLPLAEAFKLSDKSGIDVSQGTARVDIDNGAFTSRQYTSFPFRVTVKDLKAAAKEGKGVLGLDPKASEEAMKYLTQINFAGTLTGPIAAPRLKLDEKGMLTALKDTLVAAGKAELARRADEQIKKLTSELTGKVGGEVGKTVKDAAGGLLKGVLPGLGGDKKDANQPKRDKPKRGLLDGFLK